MLTNLTPSLPFSRPFLLPFALAGLAAAQQPLPPDRSLGGESVSIEQCKEWLYKLASPEFEGRGTGQPGFQKAADFVAAHFKALGLQAHGDNGSYFQNVPWATTKVKADKTFVAFQKSGAEVLRIPADRLAGTATTALSASGDVALLVVAAREGQGLQVQRAQRAEVPAIAGLADLDVSGKIVIVCVRTTEATRAGAPMARFAVQQGLAGKEPAAVLFAQDAEASGGMRGGRAGGGRGAGNPAFAGGRRSPLDATFGGKDLEAVLAAAGKDTTALAAGDAAVLVPLSVQATVEVAVEETQAPAMNVWAVFPGSDQNLKDEYVVIGSHLDHLGRRGDTINPGADDDGSGTTGVMAVAQMFAKNGKHPARSILFVCFAGEESGLIGSRFFADNCPIPLSSIVGELQMDMIGRDEEENAEGDKGEKAEDNKNTLHLVGTQKLAPSLHEICLQKNEAAGFDIEYDQEGMFGRSDHANFARMGVPIAFFFTGLHRDYHRPSDTPDKIDYPKLHRVVRYVYDIAFELASQAGRPEIDPELWAKYPRPGSKEPAAPLRAKASGETRVKDKDGKNEKD